MEGSVLTPSMEGMKHVRTKEGEMLTKPFLDVCKLILPVLDKFGPAMVIVKADIGGNISRLENKYTSDTQKFKFMYTIVLVEVENRTAKSYSSCTNALLWLTRAMDFLVQLLTNLNENPDCSMSRACNESYNKTLKKWHGWIASSSFMLALNFLPDKQKFLDVIGAGSSDVKEEITNFCSAFSLLLKANHKFLAGVGLDGMKSS
ncbi:glycolipid transfer protein 1-like [Asparagus officinalis]|uniref:glycolipid transfer protein 1-like n=1 Tax=Asparagus officinalis TaxID=4686 RepID=UPI00098E0D6A|nr:glycolipid transfer protein 1-like [Asparagus officinalis]XP_020275645.1 glycolipid transfer protein 1-like [Asparagus officinalis]XP_020275646.1 glycolipid transfer protein 1-like [Asparagus officinalis]